MNLKSLPSAVPFFRSAPVMIVVAALSFACSHNDNSQPPPPIVGGPIAQGPIVGPNGGGGYPGGYDPSQLGGNYPGAGQGGQAPIMNPCPQTLVSDYEAAGTCMNGGATEACQSTQDEFAQKYANANCSFEDQSGQQVNVSVQNGRLNITIGPVSQSPDDGSQSSPNPSHQPTAPTNGSPQDPSNDELQICPLRVQQSAALNLKMCRGIENDEDSAYDSELNTCARGASAFLNKFSAIDCEMPARGGQPAYELSSDDVTEQRTRVEDVLEKRSQDQDGGDAVQEPSHDSGDDSSDSSNVQAPLPGPRVRLPRRPAPHGAVHNAPAPQTVVD